MVDIAWQPEFRTTAIAGDRRYHYVPFHELSSDDQNRARRMYPHRSGGVYVFVPEHYLYPVTKTGMLSPARRELAIPYALINDKKYMASIGYSARRGR